MPCYHPKPAARMPSGSISFRRGDVATRGGMLIPCGTCVGCQLSVAREWAIRAKLELAEHLYACWTTLTYDAYNCPPTLSKDALSGFVKRLRSQLAPSSFRFFGCGEYGERRGRPHYHCILYGVQRPAPIQSCWKFGDARVDSITDGTIPYVAGYMNKKIGDGACNQRMRLDTATGELYEYQPPFRLMSRNPGIGGKARRFVSSWRKSAIWNGVEVPVPRYLHEAYKAAASAVDLERLQWEKDSAARARSEALLPERLAAAEQIARARVRQSSERRLVG